MCMSRQAAQPLIWLTRTDTSSCVVIGSAVSLSALPADIRYLRALPVLGSAMKSSRASMVCSSVLVSGYTPETRQPAAL